jgi:hypothetical protein
MAQCAPLTAPYELCRIESPLVTGSPGRAGRRQCLCVGGGGHAYANFAFFSGRLRTGLPVAAKIALRTAGVITQMVGSPTPPQKS